MDLWGPRSTPSLEFQADKGSGVLHRTACRQWGSHSDQAKSTTELEDGLTNMLCLEHAFRTRSYFPPGLFKSTPMIMKYRQHPFTMHHFLCAHRIPPSIIITIGVAHEVSFKVHCAVTIPDIQWMVAKSESSVENGGKNPTKKTGWNNHPRHKNSGDFRFSAQNGTSKMLKSSK